MNWSVQSLINPSILSADFSRLGEQVTEVLDAGARAIHVDVMDGQFVEPITFGPLAVTAIADRVHAAGATIDVHLMIDRPERRIADFLSAGADSVTVHVEATPHVQYALAMIREGGATAGLAVCPSTPVSVFDDLLDDVDMALCMSVNPGWGHQTLIPHAYAKLAQLRAMLPETIGVEVDGGVHDETAPRVAEAGANVLVAGSAIFGSEDPAGAFRALGASAWPGGRAMSEQGQGSRPRRV